MSEDGRPSRCGGVWLILWKENQCGGPQIIPEKVNQTRSHELQTTVSLHGLVFLDLFPFGPGDHRGDRGERRRADWERREPRESAREEADDWDL